MSRNVHWRQHGASHSTSSGRSDHSDRSYDTAPTEYSDHRPSLAHSETCYPRIQGQSRTRERDYFASAPRERDAYERYEEPPAARASVDTYASTSRETLAGDEDNEDDMPEYDVPSYRHEPLPCDALPTTPRDFGELFPTGKRISIRHDDATIDGNMNLRVDTQLERGNRKQNYTLYHLRMQDLRTREFSLRRYCRDSGREVCHSIRKYQPPPSEKRPVLQRASTALASFVKSDSRPSTSAGLKRSDSGYESVRGGVDEDDEDDFEAEPRPKPVGYSKGRALIPTNTIKLEFSNYAHMDVKRRGAKSYKKYAFEYWGHDYSWKRIVKKENPRDQESVSYYLIREDNDKEPLAHICPWVQSQEQAREEAARGGWIPPCYMRITDDRILHSDSDIADVVVATGLMALVDDCIKRRFHSKQSTQLHIPLLRSSSFKMNMEYIGPKRLIDEVFHRKNSDSGSPKKQPPTALRRIPTQA